MNVSELARLLKVHPQDLRDRLPQMGFDIGQKAIKVDNSVANKIIRIWPKFSKQIEEKKKMELKIEKTDEKEVKVKKIIEVAKYITVKDFATEADIPVNVVLAELMKNSIFASLNEKIDFDTASVIADDLGLEVRTKEELSSENKNIDLKALLGKEEKDSMLARPPVIVVMGHVDHGKTKLLDAIRRTNVIDGEAGGITQHIGAYQVVRKEKPITFVDTPGHEAFTAMRSRGAKIADVAILVVAADDGVKPQTIEAFRIIEVAKLPFVVAINKIDKPEANIEKTKQELSSKLGVLPEDWGGKIICVPISAKDGQGIETLLDMVLLMADMESENIKANPLSAAVGTVVESHLNKDEGPVATILVQNGTLKIGDQLSLHGIGCGKVRALKNYRGEHSISAGPSTPVKIIGLKIMPAVGDILQVGEGEKVKFSKFKNAPKEQTIAKSTNGEDVNFKKYNFIIKADVLGSAEAVEESLIKISTSDVKANIIHKGLGNITENDIKRAEAAGAVIYGFNIKTSAVIDELAREKNVIIKIYRVIYDLINEVKKQMQDLLEPELRHTDLGKMKAKAIFRTENRSQIVGGVIIEGKIEKDSQYSIFRNGEHVDKGKITRLQAGKQDVVLVEHGQECGIQTEGAPVIQIGDELHFYKEEKIIKKL